MEQSFRAETPRTRLPGEGAYHGYAASTPTTDGERLYVFFGKSGVFCFDLDGNELWHVSVGDGINGWGSGCSPILYRQIPDRQRQHRKQFAGRSRQADRRGSLAGQRESTRHGIRRSSIAGKDRTELVVSTENRLMSFNPNDGMPFWNADGVHRYVCPSVVAHDGVVYAIGGGHTSLAVRTGGSGDVTASHGVWRQTKGSNVCSPIYLRRPSVLGRRRRRIVCCQKAATGETVFQTPARTGCRDDLVVSRPGRRQAVHRLAAERHLRRRGQADATSCWRTTNSKTTAAAPTPRPAVNNGQLLLRTDKPSVLHWKEVIMSSQRCAAVSVCAWLVWSASGLSTIRAGNPGRSTATGSPGPTGFRVRATPSCARRSGSVGRAYSRANVGDEGARSILRLVHGMAGKIRQKRAANLLHLGYATSDDGVRWTKYAGNPIFRDRWTEDPCVVKHDDTYYMYAEDETADRTVIHLLTSRDRVNWKSQGTVLPRREGVAWEARAVGTPVVWRESEKKWSMLYDAWPPGLTAIATSEDGKHWSRSDQNQLLTTAVDKQWKTQSIVPDSIIRVDGTYHLFYHASDRAFHTGHASSADLRQWTADKGNPILQDKSAVVLDAGDAYFMYTSKDGDSGEINLYTSPKVAPIRAMPPETPKKPVTDVYHGVTVADDYRWLEDWNDPQVKKWSDAQNAHARAFLDHLPHVAAIRARVTEIMSAKTVSYSRLEYRKGMLFAIKREPPKQQPFLIVLSSPDALDRARVLVDPNEIDAAGTTSIDWYVPSPDGNSWPFRCRRPEPKRETCISSRRPPDKKCTKSSPASTRGPPGAIWPGSPTARVSSTRGIPGGRTAAGRPRLLSAGLLSQAGNADRRRPIRTRQRLSARRRNPVRDARPVGNAAGDGAERRRRRIRALPANSRRKVEPSGRFQGPDHAGDVRRRRRFVSHFAGRRPRGKILRSRIRNSTAPSGRISGCRVSKGVVQTIVPEGPDTIVTSFYHAPPSLLATRDRLYVIYQTGGPSELRVFDLAGKRLAGPQQLPLSSVGGLTRFEGETFSSAIRPSSSLRRITVSSPERGKPRRLCWRRNRRSISATSKLSANSPSPKTERKFPSISCSPKGPGATARIRRWSPATAATAPACRRRSAPYGTSCSTRALSARSPTCGAGENMASRGICRET